MSFLMQSAGVLISRRTLRSELGFELACVSHRGAGETCGLQGGCVTSLQSLHTQSAPHIGHRVLAAC